MQEDYKSSDYISNRPRLRIELRRGKVEELQK